MVYCLKTRLIDGIWAWKRGNLGNRPSINLASGRERQAVYSRMNLKKWWRSRLSEDEITEFLTKTERTQNIHVLLDIIYFLSSIYKKNHLFINYILRPCREISQSFEDILQGVRLLKNLEILWINSETVTEFVFRMMWNYADLGGFYSPRPLSSVDNIFLDLHYSSHHTQPHSIIAHY